MIDHLEYNAMHSNIVQLEAIRYVVIDIIEQGNGDGVIAFEIQLW